MEVENPLHDIDNVHRDNLVQTPMPLGFHSTNGLLTATLRIKNCHFLSSTASLFEAKYATPGKMLKPDE